MRISSRFALTATLVLTLANCVASTKLISSWRAPDAQPLNMGGKKVAAIVISSNQSMSRGAEVSLAREISARGAIGMPGYGIIPEEERADSNKVQARLESNGIEAVVVMRPVSKEKQVNYVPGASYWGGPMYGGGFYGYYGHGYASPGYLTTDTIITVETLVYDLKPNKLVWAGMSQTFNPAHLDTFITELAHTAAIELERQGLIRKQEK